jgi:hypothetical protein
MKEIKPDNFFETIKKSIKNYFQEITKSESKVLSPLEKKKKKDFVRKRLKIAVFSIFPLILSIVVLYNRYLTTDDKMVKKIKNF